MKLQLERSVQGPCSKTFGKDKILLGEVGVGDGSEIGEPVLC